MNESSKRNNSHLKLFLRHFTRNCIFGLIAGLFILLIGMFGLKTFEGYGLVDAYANAATIISGFGMIGTVKTDYGKIFVGTYSVFGGGAFLLIIGVVFSPIFHWFLRKMRVEDRDHF